MPEMQIKPTFKGHLKGPDGVLLTHPMLPYRVLLKTSYNGHSVGFYDGHYECINELDNGNPYSSPITTGSLDEPVHVVLDKLTEALGLNSELNSERTRSRGNHCEH